MQHFGEIRSLIASKPGRTAWKELCRLLDETPEAQRDEIVLHYCKGHFTDPHSPWGKYRRPAPVHWMEPLKRGERFPVILSITSHLELGLWGEDVDHVIELLATTEHMGLLRVLKLQSSQLTSAHIQQLASSPNMRHLTALHLPYNQIDDAGVEALVSSPHLDSLQLLDLQGNKIGDAGVAAIASDRGLPALKWLDMNNNDPITDAGVASMAAAEHRPASLRASWRRW